MLLAVSQAGWLTLAGVTITAIASVAAAWIGRRTERRNTIDHGEVIEVLTRLDNSVHALDQRVTGIGQSVGDLREAHIRHLEHHLTKQEDTP